MLHYINQLTEQAL